MKRMIIFAIICTLFIAGCTEDKQIVGDDRDEHGCIGSAGYSWCEEKQKCLRTWEEPCKDETLISNFEECIAAGYPAMESYPRQCRTKDDRTFTEEIQTNDAEIYCDNENAAVVYSCGKYVKVVSSLEGAGSKYYKSDGTDLICPVVAPDSMSQECKDLINIECQEVCVNDPTEIKDFEDCVKAGYDVLESVPRQCTTPEATRYYEEDEGNFCGTSTGGECIKDSDCITGGCSGQVCQSSSEESVITDCAMRTCYNDDEYGVACLCVDNRCMWNYDDGTLPDEIENTEDNEVDFSCQTADDCILAIPSKLKECPPCDPYGCEFFEASNDLVVAINKDWKPDCPPKPEGIMCAACIGGISGEYTIECVDDTCQKIIGQ